MASFYTFAKYKFAIEMAHRQHIWGLGGSGAPGSKMQKLTANWGRGGQKQEK